MRGRFLGSSVWPVAGAFDGTVLISGKLIATGPKCAVVPFPDGTHRQLYCLESPQSWFEDFGFVDENGEPVSDKAEQS